MEVKRKVRWVSFETFVWSSSCVILIFVSVFALHVVNLFYVQVDRRATLVSSETAALRAAASSAPAAGGGLFTNVRNWFGAPVQEETAQDSTPKKGNSSSSSAIEAKTPASVKKETQAQVTATATTGAKPLNALQQAKADAKKAEAERMASLSVNKKGAKKG
jgi:cytoskeletal protein RodZ